jgi:hypothetical protein
MIEMNYPRPVRRKLIAGVYHFWFGAEWHRSAILVTPLEAERAAIVDNYLEQGATNKERALFLAQWKLQGCPVRMPQFADWEKPFNDQGRLKKIRAFDQEQQLGGR